MTKCVIFDLDDTLYPEVDYCKSGMREISKMLSAALNIASDEIFDRIWSRFMAGDRDMLFNKILDEFEYRYRPDFITKLITVYREHKPDITLPLESEAVLRELSGKYTLALLSDGFMPAQRLKVEALGIGDYFAETIFSQELGSEFWKPSTVGFERILTNLGIAPQMSVYVGDNIKKDFIAPNKLGMHSVQYSRPQKVHEDVEVDEDAMPEYKIASLGELDGCLNIIWGKCDV